MIPVRSQWGRYNLPRWITWWIKHRSTGFCSVPWPNPRHALQQGAGRQVGGFQHTVRRLHCRPEAAEKGGSSSQQPQNESWRDQLCDIYRKYRNVTCEQLIFLRWNWLENDWKPDSATETRKREAFCPPVFHPGLWRMLARTQAWCQVLSGWEPDLLQQAPCGYGHVSWRGTRRIAKECVKPALNHGQSWIPSKQLRLMIGLGTFF